MQDIESEIVYWHHNVSERCETSHVNPVAALCVLYDVPVAILFF